MRLKLPVPESAWALATLPVSRKAVPKTSSWHGRLSAGRPSIGRYSLSMESSAASAFSAARTLGSGHGLPSGVRYAPMPRFTFCANLSSLYSAASPRIGSGGAIFTPAKCDMDRT